jgi:hypothetical protein
VTPDALNLVPLAFVLVIFGRQDGLASKKPGSPTDRIPNCSAVITATAINAIDQTKRGIRGNLNENPKEETEGDPGKKYHPVPYHQSFCHPCSLHFFRN